MAEVSTSMDQLVELLKDRGAVKVSQAAEELDVDKGHIESWAKMLEKANAIELHYSVIGGAVLKKGKDFDSIVQKVKSGEIKSEGSTKKLSKEAKEEPKEEPKKEEAPGNAPQEYKLIRKKITDEEKVIEDDIRKLRDEQVRIVQYMSKVIEEGNNLIEYIENLRQLVERTNEIADKKIEGATPEKK
jgi:hypothetical protein